MVQTGNYNTCLPSCYCWCLIGSSIIITLVLITVWMIYPTFAVIFPQPVPCSSPFAPFVLLPCRPLFMPSVGCCCTLYLLLLLPWLIPFPFTLVTPLDRDRDVILSLLDTLPYLPVTACVFCLVRTLYFPIGNLFVFTLPFIPSPSLTPTLLVVLGDPIALPCAPTPTPFCYCTLPMTLLFVLVVV